MEGKIARRASVATAAALATAIGAGAPASAEGGFDQYGYNYKANVFSGPADGVDRNLDGKVWGDPTYASDHLVMKWNEQWDDCNDAGNNDEEACAGAWTTNEWNGMSPDGSQSNWHYKIIWVGVDQENSELWREGGYPIWGSYEVIQDQGVDGGEHIVFAQGVPNGLEGR